MLRYEPSDWNALHRDLYGDLVFPLQVVIGLDRPERDYTGGEFVVVEQRPARPVTSDDAHDPSRTRHRVHHPGSTDQVGAWMGLRPHASRREHAAQRETSDIGPRVP